MMDSYKKKKHKSIIIVKSFWINLLNKFQIIFWTDPENANLQSLSYFHIYAPYDFFYAKKNTSQVNLLADFLFISETLHGSCIVSYWKSNQLRLEWYIYIQKKKVIHMLFSANSNLASKKKQQRQKTKIGNQTSSLTQVNLRRSQIHCHLKCTVCQSAQQYAYSSSQIFPRIWICLYNTQCVISCST